MSFFACPCCGSSTLSERDVYEICTVCGWEDDPFQSSDPELRGGANVLSLNEARSAWQTRGTQTEVASRN